MEKSGVRSRSSGGSTIDAGRCVRIVDEEKVMRRECGMKGKGKDLAAEEKIVFKERK